MTLKRLALTMMFTLAAAALFPTEVGLEKARMAGTRFFLEKTGDDPVLGEVFTRAYRDFTAYYVFTAKPAGFVIISAEDVLPPVIGYSVTGTYQDDNQPDSYRNFMQTYCDAVEYIRLNQIAQATETGEMWSYYLNEGYTPPAAESSGKSVAPLVPCQWNQGAPYNVMCPADPAGPGGHVYAGCVATAMSQVMYYWRYPLQGTGSHSYYYPPYGNISANFGATSYQWEGMQHSITYDDPVPIAELQFHCGVGVDMMYGPNGSGAYSSDVPQALENFFGYDTDCYYTWKDDHTNSEWINMLKNNLDNGWPMYYSGYSSSGGHAFVCDGYQDDYFHFNFGWGGSSDGYYTLLTVAGFNDGQGAVLDTYPGSGYPYYCSGNHVLTLKRGSIEDGSGPVAPYEDNASCTWLIDLQGSGDSISGIKFRFERFDTQAGDKLTIYDGPTAQSPVLAVFSGNQLPAAITSTNDQALIEFISDGSGTANGWLLEYTGEAADFCQGVVIMEGNEGSFTDGSGSFNYHNSTVCFWEILPPGADHVTLQFTHFNTEQDHDRVLIYDFETQELLAEYSGSFPPDALPEPVTAGSGKMFVAFATNSSVTATGWSAHYSTTSTGITNPTGYTGDGCSVYPNPATDRLYIETGSISSGQTDIRLFSLSGELLLSESRKVEDGRNTLELGLEGLTPGSYLLQVTGDAGTVTHRVVVQQ
ncbi:MAG: C10 family peptidase [Bacteroidales bacterium]|nr:C10 family peptidase [Bacteroidales bacterium]